jgi:cell division protein FtsW
MRKMEENRYDYVILSLVMLLLCFGLVMVYSASHHVALRRFGDESLFFRRHFFRVAIGLAVLIIAAVVPYKFWLKGAKFWLLGGLGLLIWVLTDGVEKGNAQRWIQIYSLRFQPVDFVRLAVILYLSDAMIRKREVLGKWNLSLAPQLLILGVIALLLSRQPDMGSVIILFLISAVIFITAGVNPLQLGLVALAGLPILILTQNYQITRVKDFINSLLYGQPLTYQINQSLISLGSGGLLGKGLDNSTQKLEFLPEPFTDFIFAIVGEEFGFLGAALVLTLFLVLVIQGLRIARNCDDDAGALLASGITASIALYTFLNAGVVTNLLPTKGLPMPFISFGGSFMITTLAGIGILLNISQHHEIRLVRRRPAEARSGRLRQNRRRIG